MILIYLIFVVLVMALIFIVHNMLHNTGIKQQTKIFAQITIFRSCQNNTFHGENSVLSYICRRNNDVMRLYFKKDHAYVFILKNLFQPFSTSIVKEKQYSFKRLRKK